MSRRTFRPALAFHVLTPLYDWATDLVGFGAPFVSRVADSLALRETESVLDVGCGTGTLLAELGHRYPRAAVAGIDADFRMLARARRKLVSAQARATLVQAYAQHLPFSAGPVDAVVSTLIFHHLGTPLKQAALGEIHRVLKPGGAFSSQTSASRKPRCSGRSSQSAASSTGLRARGQTCRDGCL